VGPLGRETRSAPHDHLEHLVAAGGAESFFQDLALPFAEDGMDESGEMDVLLGLDLGRRGQMGDAVAEGQTSRQLTLQHPQDSLLLRP